MGRERGGMGCGIRRGIRAGDIYSDREEAEEDRSCCAGGADPQQLQGIRARQASHHH